MPVSTQTRPAASDGRTKLVEAHTALADAQSAVQAAEALQDEATVEHYRAQSVVSEIQVRMDLIAGQWNIVHPPGRDDLQAKLNECQAPLKEAKQPLMALSIAVEAAEAKVAEARQRLSFYHSRVRDAAAAAVRAEAPKLTTPAIERLEAAFAVVLELGPDVYRMIHENLLPRDTVTSPFSHLLNSMTTQWPAFEQRFRASPWRGTVAALEQDVTAPLPTMPAAL